MSERKRESSSQEAWKQDVRKTEGKGGFLPRKSFENFKTQQK